MRFNSKLLVWAVLVLVVVFTPVGDMLLVVVETIGDTAVDVLRNDLAELLRLVGFMGLVVFTTAYLLHIGPKLRDRLVGPRTPVGQKLLDCHGSSPGQVEYGAKIARLAGAPNPAHHQMRSDYRTAVRAWEKSLTLDGRVDTTYLEEDGSLLMVCLGCMRVRTVLGGVQDRTGFVERFEDRHGCEARA